MTAFLGTLLVIMKNSNAIPNITAINAIAIAHAEGDAKSSLVSPTVKPNMITDMTATNNVSE